MTPMIDVVFQLIIFFLVASHIAKQEAQFPLPLPVATTGSEAVDGDKPRAIVNILPDGTLTLAGIEVAPEELRRRIERERQASGPDLEVRIRGSRNVPYRQVEPVLLACTRAGIWNVTIAVQLPEPSGGE